MFGRFLKPDEVQPKPSPDQKAPATAPAPEVAPKAPVNPKRNIATAGHGMSAEAREASDKMTDLKVKLHRTLLDRIDFSKLDQIPEAEFAPQVERLIRELIISERLPLNKTEQESLITDVVNEVIGYGPIEPLLKDPTVTDILVNTHSKVFVERYGKLELTNARFADNRHLMRIIQKIVAQVGRRIDESQPLVDARLPDGSRVNAVVHPIAVDGPLVSIRKFAKVPITMPRLIELGALAQDMADVLKGCVEARQNIIISGGTGSGKTTMLNALSAYIGNAERIVTIEDAAELQLQQIHVARLETRPPNVEGRGEIRQRELVKNALRMRPDRIILGEVRGGEAFDMLQAMNTGHEGSMTTIHANTPRDALSRMEQMIGMSEIEIPTISMRSQIASAIDVIVQTQRLSDGKRRLVSVSEITGMEGSVIQMQEIFHFQRKGIADDGTVMGEYRATGIRPQFAKEFKTRGIEIDPEVYREDRVLG
ncbi:CpaF family protein [Limibacillus sp. MBR-115]|jgi:pilus assembly protein CpaF|uniref:CpaF family protein n=1 Tax=Limibacillus sp. MBR-115 TaxID=3156465 RepID=UPI0033948557